MSRQSKSVKSYPAEFREKAVRRWKAAAKQKLDPDTAVRMELE